MVAATASPSIPLKTSGRPTFVAVKEDGRLYARAEYPGTWSGWVNMGGTWETGEPADELFPPEWISDAELTLESISRFDFTITWGALADAADSLILRITDSDGLLWQDEYINPRTDPDFTVSQFQGSALTKGEVYSLSLVAVNDAGSSAALTGDVVIPDFYALSSEATVIETAEATAFGAMLDEERCWERTTEDVVGWRIRGESVAHIKHVTTSVLTQKFIQYLLVSGIL